MIKKSKAFLTTRLIAYSSVSAAAVCVSTLLGFSSPQFYFNLGDTVILIISVIFGPVVGMFAGGIGSFLADLIVYPATMLFTLIIKGTEGLFVGLVSHIIGIKIKKERLKIFLTTATIIVGSYLMMAGYFIAQSLFYGNLAGALIALPMDAVQATVSFTLATIILFVFKGINLKNKFNIDSNGRIKK